MVEQENSQASPVFPRQSMNSWENMKSGFQSNTVEQDLIPDTAEVDVQLEAKSLCNTILNVDFDEEASNLFLPESENPNIFSENEPNLMRQNNDEFSLSNENDQYNIPEQFSNTHDQYRELGSPVSLWSCSMDLDVLKMDDVFQVNEEELLQSPTLAELNANDESLFDSLDCFELGLFTENKALTNVKSPKSQNENSSSPLIRSDLQNFPSQFKLSSNKLIKISPDENLDKPNTMHLQLNCDNVKLEPDCEDTPQIQLKSSHCDTKLQTVPSISLDHISQQLKTPISIMVNPVKTESQHLDSLKSNMKEYSEEEKKQKKENVNHVVQQIQGESYDSDDEEDSDMDFYNSSDADSSDEQTKPTVSILQKKRSRYFWQYNTQAKGPKGPRMKLAGSSSSLKNYPDVDDPIFNSHEMEGVKHAGKARRGDGNDLTPNPRKLYSIGVELQKLNSVIDNLIPVNELPFNARSKSRKEKNKLASRACRLKKKAQHEANKLKLFGLQQEQKFLLNSILNAKRLLKQVLEDNTKLDKQILEKIKTMNSRNTCIKVAGHSAEFVNQALEKVADGDSTGGLKIMQTSHEKY